MGETISKGKGGFEGIGKVVWLDWMELEMQLYHYKQFLKPLLGADSISILSIREGIC